MAEIVGQYLRKGSKIYVEGSLRTRKWQDKNGVERYTTEIIANEMQMLDSKGGANSSAAIHTNQQQKSNHIIDLDHMHPETDFTTTDDDDIPF